jgi:hypothetical protein
MSAGPQPISPRVLLISGAWRAIPDPREEPISPQFLRVLTLRIAAGLKGGAWFMNTFEERQKGFERKFAHDEELRFKSTARRNKLLGLWAAEKLGLSDEEAQAYAKEVVKADLAEPGEEDVFRKIRADFDAKGVDQSDHQIRRAMADLLAEAVNQIETESKG